MIAHSQSWIPLLACERIVNHDIKIAILVAFFYSTNGTKDINQIKINLYDPYNFNLGLVW